MSLCFILELWYGLKKRQLMPSDVPLRFVFLLLFVCLLLVLYCPVEAQRGCASMIASFSHPPIVHCQHQFILWPPTMGLPLVTVWLAPAPSSLSWLVNSHMGQCMVVMTGITGQYGPQHDWTLQKWHSWHDIQMIWYQGYKTEHAKAQSVLWKIYLFIEDTLVGTNWHFLKRAIFL